LGVLLLLVLIGPNSSWMVMVQ